MSIAEELAKLEALRAAGTINEAEFQRAKARVLDGPAPSAAPHINNLRRSLRDRWIGGVCGGLAAITGVDTWIWRLLTVLLTVFAGSGLLLYLLLWIFVPNESAT